MGGRGGRTRLTSGRASVPFVSLLWEVTIVPVVPVVPVQNIPVDPVVTVVPVVRVVGIVRIKILAA